MESYYKMVYRQTNIVWNFEVQRNQLIPAKRPDFMLINKQKRTCHLVNFAIPVDDWVKIKENKRQILGPCLRTKKLWNMRITGIPIVVDVLGKVRKGLEKRLEELEIKKRIETIQTIAMLRSARILRKVLETWGDLLSLRLEQKTTNYK